MKHAAIILLLAASLLAQSVGTLSELMLDVIYPTSNAIFYILRAPPKTDADWTAIKTQALTLAESANLLTMPERAKDQDKWMADAKLLRDAGTAAYRAAQAKNLEAIVALNDQLYEACVQCHTDYRPGYNRRPDTAKQAK
jgi:hypothetical protein